MAAVIQDGWTLLEYASVELKAVWEIVLAVVVQDGWTLQDASGELKAVREIILAVVVQDGWALLEYVSGEL